MARVADVHFHPQATAEFDAAIDWYFERSPQAAEDFVYEVDRAIARIAENPSRWTEYLYGARKYLLQHFPYVIVYLVQGDQLQIVAVAHGRRRPGYWRERVKGR